MSETVHRFAFNESYIIDKLEGKYIIDYEKANDFHEGMIDLHYGLTNLLARLFIKDDEYGTLLQTKENVMTKLGTKEEDFDFVVKICNEENMNTFYDAHSLYTTLIKVQQYKDYLIEQKLVDEEHYLDKLSSCIAFLEEAKKGNQLVHFWNQY